MANDMRTDREVMEKLDKVQKLESLLTRKVYITGLKNQTNKEIALKADLRVVRQKKIILRWFLNKGKGADYTLED